MLEQIFHVRKLKRMDCVILKTCQKRRVKRELGVKNLCHILCQFETQRLFSYEV